MPARVLEHYNIRTRDLVASVAFYTRVLGLREGPRPSTRPGAWIYDARDVPVVHMAFDDPADPIQQAHIRSYLGERDPSTLHGGGAVDHIAFSAIDYAGTMAHLAAHGLAYRERLTDAGLPQIFVNDPNGITIELNFNDERRPA